MKNIKVKLSGISPMLMHRFQIEEDKEKKAKKEKIYDSKVDAEAALYKDEKGCYVPATWIESNMRTSAKEFTKKGHKTMKSDVSGFVMVDGEKIHLNKETYDEIDIRPVVVGKARIARSRPKFNNWKLEFELLVDDEKIEPSLVKSILVDGGMRLGLGDYRPQNGGRFGRFKVDEFEVV